MGEVTIVEDGNHYTVYDCWNIKFTAFWHPALIDITTSSLRHDIFFEAISHMYEINSTIIYYANLHVSDMDVRWSSEEVDDANVHAYFDLSNPIVIDAETILGNPVGDRPPPLQ